MKKNRLLITFLLLALALIVSGCRGSGTVASSWPGITIIEDKAYIAFNTSLHVVNASNGVQQAIMPDKPINAQTTFFHPPVELNESELLLGSYKKALYSFNLNTQQLEVFFNDAKSRWIAAPLMTDLGIFAANVDGTLYALDTNGNVQWSFETEDTIWASPVLEGETLYLTSMDRNIYALDATSGKKLWSTELGQASVSSPAIGEDGTLYIGTFGSAMMAIDSATGDILWQVKSEDWIWASPTIVGETLYFADISGTVYALDTATQDFVWQMKGDGPVSGAPLYFEDSLFFSTQTGTVYALNMEGGVRWQKSIEDVEFNGPLVLADELILAGAVGSESLVYAFDTNGTIQWQYTPEN